MRWSATLGTVALLSAAPILLGAGESGDAGSAIREFDSAQAAYDAGRFNEALKHYLASYRIGHDAAVLFSVGECYRQLKSYSKARAYYLRYLSEVPNAPYAELVRDLVQELDAKIAETRSAQAPPLAEHTPAVVPASPVRESATHEDLKPEPESKPEALSATESQPAAETDVPVAPPAEATPFGAPAGAQLGVGATLPPPRDAHSNLVTQWWFWTAVVAVVAAGSVAGYFVFRPSGPTPTLGTVNGQ